VGEGGLAPTGIEKSNAIFFIAQILCGGFDDDAFEVRQESTLLALKLQNVMDFTGTSYWEGYLEFVLVWGPVKSTGYLSLET
jgi:hypothetical protein